MVVVVVVEELVAVQVVVVVAVVKSSSNSNSYTWIAKQAHWKSTKIQNLVTVEYLSNVRIVNTVKPAFVNTAMHAMNRKISCL